MIILDLALPDIDKFEVLKEIHRFSEENGVNDLVRALGRFSNRYLTPPAI
jgi:DNA-binding response OmpR family regulator